MSSYTNEIKVTIDDNHVPVIKTVYLCMIDKRVNYTYMKGWRVLSRGITRENTYVEMRSALAVNYIITVRKWNYMDSYSL